MKRNVIALASLALALGALALPSAQAAETSSSSRITVSGTGSVQVDRDLASIQLSSAVSRTTAKSAMSAVSAVHAAVRKALIDAGADAKKFTTSGISLYPEYEYSTNKPVLTGYRATIGLTVSTTVKLAPTLVDVAVEAGGDDLQISGISFEASDNEADVDASRVKAVTNAKAKATKYAKALGMRLGKAVKVVETSSPTPSPIYAGYDKATAASITVDPGTTKVTTTVEITYILN